MRVLLVISLAFISLFLLWVFIVSTSYLVHTGRKKKKPGAAGKNTF
jgi:hypothetical protein